MVNIFSLRGECMTVLILNGLNSKSNYYLKVKEILGENYEGNDVINIKESKIGNCLGCFSCWVKTPGECILQDDGNIIARKVINVSKLIIITETTFGGYSSSTKRVIDRLIPNVSPLFINVNNETHHKKRYEKYPDMTVIAVTDEDDEAKLRFENIVTKRNAVNFNSKNTKVKFVSTESIDKEEVLINLLREEF